VIQAVDFITNSASIGTVNGIPLMAITLAVLATSIRVLALILLSIISGWLLAYGAIKSKIFENIFISLIEIFESVPVITFFPVVLIIFVDRIGGGLGVELAADFLVFTAVVWNIWMGEYQAFKTVPSEMVEVANNYNYGFLDRMGMIYIPFSIPRIAANLFPSVSDGFFYITVSEVFSIGLTTYATFGIGTEISSLLAQSNYYGVLTAFIIMGIIIVIIVLALRSISERAVAKYTVDTDMPIMRRGKPRIRQTARFSAVASLNTLGKLAKYNRERRPQKDPEELFSTTPKKGKGNIIAGLVALAIFLYIIYSAIELILGVSAKEWDYLFSKTPSLLYGLMLDYLRVITITLISLFIALTLGYYFATRKRVEKFGIPVIQTLSAYPVPAYFPFLFLGIYPFVDSIFGSYTEEALVLFLGFLSTFYYVFYGFWMGVKAMPSEYNEIMRNLDLGFFQKMRYVIIPSTFPYLISGITSTVNSAWGGLEIGEYWPHIAGNRTLQVHSGLMKTIDVATSTGNIALAAWGSFLFAIIVAVYSIIFTKKMMDLAKKKYVAEEGIYSV
jgi:NitT/TauT family transport system permease protein